MASNRDRQKRWRAKQEAAGRKRFTVVVEREIYEILMVHKARSGESLAALISRAVRLLEDAPGDRSASLRPEAPPPKDGERGIDEARSMIRRLLTLGNRRSGQK